ncbi:MAG: Uma2 family endonuclease [Clostridiales bacterium]|nr:Uma2 family endonuclease [Clostridiales bacterium]
MALEQNKHEDPTKTEMIDGVIYNMAAGTSKHADVVSNIHGLLFTYFRKKTCKPYTSELEIRLDEKTPSSALTYK